jgi:broad specificity phosphatase PhoE
LIRHGRTSANAEGRLMGHRAIGLDDVGRAQASAVGAALRDQLLGPTRPSTGEGRVVALVTSPLQRAVETAEHIVARIGDLLIDDGAAWSEATVAGRGAVSVANRAAGSTREAFRVDARLAEMDFGAAVDAEGPRVKLRVKEHHRFAPLPGGESLHDVWCRVDSFVEEHVERADACGELVVVSHYRTLQLLHARLCGASFDDAVDHATLRAEHAEIYRWSPMPTVSPDRARP